MSTSVSTAKNTSLEVITFALKLMIAKGLWLIVFSLCGAWQDVFKRYYFIKINH